MRVLIVDDHSDQRRSLHLLMRALGHEVASAADGMAGISLAALFQPDAALIDLQMPFVSGIDVAHALRASPATRHARLILMTASADITTLEAQYAGFDVLLQKPATLAAILAALHVAGPIPRAAGPSAGAQEAAPHPSPGSRR